MGLELGAAIDPGGDVTAMKAEAFLDQAKRAMSVLSQYGFNSKEGANYLSLYLKQAYDKGVTDGIERAARTRGAK